MEPTRAVRPFEVDQRVHAERRPAHRHHRTRAARQRRRDRRRAARRDRNRQVGDDGLADRAGAAADARARAQQDPRRPAGERVPRADAEQRRRVLRQLLRLLPARGLRPADRHLHREGLVGQRRGRAAPALDDELAAQPARRRRRRRRCPASTVSVPRRSTWAPWWRCRWASGSPATRLVRRFIDMQYERNDVDFSRGKFRVRGDTIEIIPVYEEHAIRIEMFGDEIEALYSLHPLTGDVIAQAGCRLACSRPRTTPPAPRRCTARSRTHPGRTGRAPRRVRDAGQAARGAAAAHAHHLRPRDDGADRLLQRHRELLAAHRRPRARARRRTACSTTSPTTSSSSSTSRTSTVPQIGAMYEGDASRKRTLVEHGFRLPSALDNRPLRWEEFLDRVGQKVYLSATPGRYELGIADGVVEQIIRPTGLIDPQIVVKPSEGPDRRPARGDPAPRRAQRARARHDPDQEDGGGADRLPRRGGRAGALPALGRRHPASRRAAHRAARGRLRRARRHQPAARGPRPARGVARRDPRRRQGGLPALVDLAHPDHRPRRPQRVGRGAHVRRQPDRLDEARDRRDRPPPREAGRVQRRARHRPDSRCASGSPTSPTCWPARAPTRLRCSRGAVATARKRAPDAEPAPRGHRRRRAPTSSRRSSPTSTTRCCRPRASSSSSSRRACATSSRT